MDNPWVWRQDIFSLGDHRRGMASCKFLARLSPWDRYRHDHRHNLSPLRRGRMVIPLENPWEYTDVVASHNRRNLQHRMSLVPPRRNHASSWTMALSTKSRASDV